MIYKLTFFEGCSSEPLFTSFSAVEGQPMSAVRSFVGWELARLIGANHALNVTTWAVPGGTVRCEPAVPADLDNV